MSKVVFFYSTLDAAIADQINLWLCEHPGYRVSTIAVSENSRRTKAWVAFEPVR